VAILCCWVTLLSFDLVTDGCVATHALLVWNAHHVLLLLLLIVKGGILSNEKGLYGGRRDRVDAVLFGFLNHTRITNLYKLTCLTTVLPKSAVLKDESAELTK
jgi:hypothetical protein